MQNEKLFKQLYFSKDETEVETILKAEGFWDNPSNWRDIGDNPGNWTIIGGQQKDPLNALIEKIINVGDSVLLNKCHEAGMNPEDLSKVPPSLAKAVEIFLGVPGGDLSNITSREITKLANDCGGIITSPSNQDENPHYTIFDIGEGQSPESFPSTFMSLANSNKIKIPFVQGKHCAGSFGAIRFCNFQLILSRRNPKIMTKGQSNNFGFTITRVFPATNNNRSPIVKYLVLDGDVPSFQFNGPLKVLCSTEEKDIQKFDRNFFHGSIIKLFNYKIGKLPGQKSDVNIAGNGNVELRKALNRRLLSPASPTRLYDQRPPVLGKKRNSSRATVDGLMKKINLDKNQELEKNMPIGISIRENGQIFNVQVYVLKESANKSSWHKDDGIMYSLNGQVNSVQNSSIYKSKEIRLSNLGSYIFTIVDCSSLDNNHISKMFLNNREGLTNDQFVLNFKNKLYNEIKNHPELKRLSQEFDNRMSSKLFTNKNMESYFETLAKKFPSLMQLLKFDNKGKIKRFGGKNQGLASFNGSKFPTYFNIKKKYTYNTPKIAEQGRSIRVDFSTDAVNDFLTRNLDPGCFEVFLGGIDFTKKSIFNASNGVWTLSVPINNLSNGKIYRIDVSLIDKINKNIFRESFRIKASKLIIKQKSKSIKTNSSSNFKLPSQTMIKENDELYKQLGFTNEHAYCIQRGIKPGEYKFTANLDNNYLKAMKMQNPNKAKEIQKCFEMSNLINQINISKLDEENKIEGDLEKFSKLHSEASQKAIYTTLMMGWR